MGFVNASCFLHCHFVDFDTINIVLERDGENCFNFSFVRNINTMRYLTCTSTTCIAMINKSKRKNASLIINSVCFRMIIRHFLFDCNPMRSKRFSRCFPVKSNIVLLTAAASSFCYNNSINGNIIVRKKIFLSCTNSSALTHHI